MLFFSNGCVRILNSPIFPKMSANVLQLGEVAEIEAQMFNFELKFNRRTELEFCTKPAILPNCCYMPFLFGSLIIFLKKLT